MQDKLVLSFWLGDARQTNPAPFAQIEPDFNQDNALEGVNDLGWSETTGSGAQLLLQADPETVAEEGDQDVGFNPSLESVKNRPQAQLAFECAKHGFKVGQLDVLTPEQLRIPIG
jgi:hypothetical protein